MYMFIYIFIDVDSSHHAGSLYRTRETQIHKGVGHVCTCIHEHTHICR